MSTLKQLADFLDEQSTSPTLFLHLQDTSAAMIDQLQKFMHANEAFTQRTVVISRSPLTIYQVCETCGESQCSIKLTKLIRGKFNDYFKEIFTVAYD